jgi:hypothetical protein
MARHGPKPFKAGQRGRDEEEKAELLTHEKHPRANQQQKHDIRKEVNETP